MVSVTYNINLTDWDNMNFIFGEGQMKKCSIAILLLSMILVIGCDDPTTGIQVTFENTTDDPLELQVNGPGEGTGYLGPIPPGGQIITLIEVSSRFIPAVYTYTAGEYPGSFTIVDDLNPRVWETIPEGVAGNEPSYRHGQGQQQGGRIPIVVNP